MGLYQQPGGSSAEAAPFDAEAIAKDLEDIKVSSLAAGKKLELKVKRKAEADLDAEEGTERKFRLTRASDIGMVRTRWLWAGRIPVGEITLIGGRGGIGKSQVLCLLTSWITNGSMKGEFFGTPRDVIYIVNEDSVESTVVPRLVAAGADIDRVHFLDIEHLGDIARLDMSRDRERVADAVAQVAAVAVMFDPLSSNLAVKSNSGDEVRPIMERIRRMAAASGIAVIGLGHVRKGHSADFMEAIMGSSELGNVIRAAIGVMKDADDEDGGIVMSQEKNNLGRMDVSAYKFRIISAVVHGAYGEEIPTSRVDDIEKTDMRVGDMIADTERFGEGKSKIKEASDFLLDYLTTNNRGGVAPKKEIVTAARGEGISQSALERAARRLKITSSRSSGFQSGAMWAMPGA